MGLRFSAPVQTGPGAHPASCTMGTGLFPRVKRTARGANHPPLSSAEVKERAELFLYSPSGPSWPVLGRTLLLPPCDFVCIIDLEAGRSSMGHMQPAVICLYTLDVCVGVDT